MESLLQKFQTNTMVTMEKVMKETNETILQSVGSQLQGMNMAIENMKEDSDDKYSRMNEQNHHHGKKRMTMLEDPNNKGSETKANDMEGTKTQEDQNQRRAVVT